MRKVSIDIYDLDILAHPIEYRAVSPEAVSFIPLEESREIREMTLDEIFVKTENIREYTHPIADYKSYPLLLYCSL